MLRSSRHKLHKQSKHILKEDREHSNTEEEDVKMKDRNGMEEGLVRVSRYSTSGEKRKVTSLARDDDDLSVHGNGDQSNKHVASKRHKEKADVLATGGDRWNEITTSKEAQGDVFKLELDRSSKSKISSDLKSRSSRRNENVSEKDEKLSLSAEKEEGKSSSKVERKRKSERDWKESKEKENVAERERKVQDIKRDKEAEARAVDGKVARRQGSHLVEFGEEQQAKQATENTEWPMQDVLRNLELEKELEKRIRRKSDGTSNKDKSQDHARQGDDRRLSSRGERGKDGRYKDERRKDGSHGDKYQEDDDRYNRHMDNKHRQDGDRDNRSRDNKYREDGGRDNKRWEDGYREDAERDNKYRDKYSEDGNRLHRHRDDKYREDGRHRDDKYREDGDSYNRHRDDKYREDSERYNRHKDDKYWKEGDRDNRHREVKHQEDVDKDNKNKDAKQREIVATDKRPGDVKYCEERTSRDLVSDKSDIKRLREESFAGERHHRKSNNRDGSPIYDDCNTRYRNDEGKRRSNSIEDREDHSDIRYHRTKEQRSDSGKKLVNTAKVESITDRGTPHSWNADGENALNHNSRRNSPGSSSHAEKDLYRFPKQEGSRYRDDKLEKRDWHDVTSTKEFGDSSGKTEKVSLSEAMEKLVPKGDSQLGELSIGRHQRSDFRTSTLQVVDKSPSTSSTVRRHLSKSEVRQSLDVDESGQRIGGSKDAKEYSDKEGRGNCELPMETLLGDELSQADVDTSSLSSPFTRPSRLPDNSRSLLPPPPPPPFRTGVDNPLVFGSWEDDNRGKSINRHRRIGDSNMGRARGSLWNVQSWSSPMANGFLPFQHGPPPLGFHPMMQQFHAPPIFGIRPSVELNHSGVPYHIADANRFSGHGRPHGWRTLVDESCPPSPLHGWESNNTVFMDESHMYGRPDLDQNRTLTSGRGWETSGDMWKGQIGGVNTDLPVAPKKQDYSACGPADEVWTSQSGQQAQNELNQLSLLAEKIGTNKSSDAVASNTLEAPKTVPEKTSSFSKTSRMDNGWLWRVYLTKLDISADLTQPELYNQFTSLIDMDQNTNSDVDSSKILYVEEFMEAKVTISDKTSSASLFAAINDSVFQKAMSLYKKQREEMGTINGEKSPFSSVKDPEFVQASHQAKMGSKDDKPGELELVCDQLEEAEVAQSKSIVQKTELSNILQKLEVSSATTYQKTNELVQPNSTEKSEGPISDLNKVKMEVDPIINEETVENIVEDKSLSLENLVQSDAPIPLPGKEVGDVKVVSDCRGNCSANSEEEQKLFDTMFGPLLFFDMSLEAVKPESIESGSVKNLSRIHHSPESTH